ncbi:MAG: hypothetical protein ACOX7Q_16680 [Kiritimatiellia bacterium]
MDAERDDEHQDERPVSAGQGAEVAHALAEDAAAGLAGAGDEPQHEGDAEEPEKHGRCHVRVPFVI